MNKPKQSTKLSNLLGIYLLVGIAVALILGLLVIKPQMADASNVKSQVSSVNKQIEGLKQLQTQTEQLKQNYDQIKGKRDAILNQLPAQNQEERLLALLSDMSQQSGVVLNTFVPEGNVTTNATGSTAPSSLAIYGANISVTGNYSNVQAFLQQMESSARFIDVVSSGLAADGDGGANPVLTAQIAIQAYYQSSTPVGADATAGGAL